MQAIREDGLARGCAVPRPRRASCVLQAGGEIGQAAAALRSGWPPVRENGAGPESGPGAARRNSTARRPAPFSADLRPADPAQGGRAQQGRKSGFPAGSRQGCALVRSSHACHGVGPNEGTIQIRAEMHAKGPLRVDRELARCDEVAEGRPCNARDPGDGTFRYAKLQEMPDLVLPTVQARCTQRFLRVSGHPVGRVDFRVCAPRSDRARRPRTG